MSLAPMNFEMSQGENPAPTRLDWSEFSDPPIKNQTMALSSVVGPTCAQKASSYTVVVRGVAGTQEQLDLIRDKVGSLPSSSDRPT
jgi:hypothetical protein